jgi:hypothetical protein
VVVISIEIDLRRAIPPAGDITLENATETTIRTWRLGNEWGDQMISFEVLRGTTASRVVKAPQVYTKNVPSPVDVPAGARHRIPFDLGDGTWQMHPPASELFSADANLVALYEVPESREARAAGVWIGRLRSQPVPLEKPGR